MLIMNAKEHAMKHLTIRSVDSRLAKALRGEQKRGGKSLNQTVLDLLRRAVGISNGKEFDNGLGKYAGGWTEEQFQEFERNTAFLNQPDEEPKQ
jgi:hypothetical protein